MKCNFVVGQKVAAIQDMYVELLNMRISKGQIFTVVEMDAGEGFSMYERSTIDGVWLTFAEVLQREMNGKRLCFDSRFFRPLETRKTDISIFKRMLTPAGGVPVDA